MNIEEINQLCLLITNPVNNPPDQVSNANEFFRQFTSQPECVNWVLSTFFNEMIIDIKIREYQLILIKQWCTKNWDGICSSEEYFNYFRTILFTQSYHDRYHGKENVFDNLLADAQLSFMWKTFPNNWQNFWADYFSSFNEQYRLCFLESLTSFSSNLKSNDNRVFREIKNKMRENGSDGLVTEFTVKKMGEKNVNAFKVFISLCSWVNVSFLTNEQAAKVIAESLDESDFVSYSLRIISCLISRGIQNDLKFELITRLQIPDRIKYLLDLSPSIDIVTAAAELVNSAGIELIHYPDFVSLFCEHALKILTYSNDISSIVFPFLTQICKDIHESSKGIIVSILDRIQACIGDQTDDTGFLEALTDLSNVAIKSQHKENFEYLMGLFNDGQLLESNPRLAIAIICIVSNNLKSGKPIDFVEYSIPRFQLIMSIEPPIDPIFSFGIYCFINYFVAVGDGFSSDQVSPVFEKLCNFSVLGSNSVDQDFHNNITTYLSQFLKKLSKKIEQNFDTSIISRFIEKNDKQLILVAGSLIGAIKSPQEQARIFQESMQQLRALLDQADDKLDFAKTILTFVKSVKYSEDSPNIQAISQFLAEFSGCCTSDDELFSLYIRTAYSSLGNNCLEAVLNCTNYIEIGNQSIIAYCDVLQAIVKSDKIPKDEWLGQIIDFLFNIITSRFVSFQPHETDAQSEEEKEINNMAIDFIRLFSFSLTMAANFIDPNLYNRMKEFIYSILTQHFENPSLVEVSIDFVSSIASKDFDSVCNDGFIKYVVFFLYTDKFDPNQKEWYNVIKRLLAFHYHIYKDIDGERSRPLIGESLVEFLPATVENRVAIINSYFDIFDNVKLPRDQKSQGRLFYINYKKLLYPS